MNGAEPKRLLRALAGEAVNPPPWWLMRQAGRYLPEYRALRAQAADFIALCLNPAQATEVTLQPIRRFGMDAAILFSDILLVPRALGQKVGFRNDGPALEAVTTIAGLSSAGVEAQLSPVFEAAARVRRELPAETALIGFAGAPWTVATYMVEGGSSRDFARVKGWAYRDPDGFDALIGLIEEATVAFLGGQIAAGVEIVQLFDSWSGVLPEVAFARWVIAPTRRIVARLRARFPGIPVIGFPRGAGLLYERYVAETGITAIGLDTTMPIGFAATRLQSRMPVQGNLDPVALLAGGEALGSAVRHIRQGLGGGPHVFNLGHGVLPETPPEHVAELARLLAEPA
ncbi:MAG TPA: uroporphyrinogen decarboxylase [Stellaceae bacterium]|jgi:uroporphyrinogen decarboxylase|nr:uroporphyrinogen decarboxylase [Stellaceae bacterium]